MLVVSAVVVVVIVRVALAALARYRPPEPSAGEFIVPADPEARHRSCGTELWTSESDPGTSSGSGESVTPEEELPVAKTIVNTPDAPGSASHGTFPYSQAVVAGGLVFVSGQGPFDPATGSIVGSTIQEQTRQVLRNCDAILRAAGSSMDKVVSATFILRHPEDFAGMNEEWARWFTTDPPARQGAAHPLDIEGSGSRSRSSPKPERQ